MLHALSKEGYHLTQTEDPSITAITAADNISSTQQKTEPQSPPHKAIIQWLIAQLLSTCTILGCLVAFVPRVVVYPPSTPLIPDDAFSVTFDVSNNNFVPLNDVNVQMQVS